MLLIYFQKAGLLLHIILIYLWSRNYGNGIMLNVKTF